MTKTIYNTMYTKKDFYNAVAALINGEEPDVEEEVILDTCAYELDRLERDKVKARAKATHKDWRESDYVKALTNDILPLLTTEPMSAAELSEKAPVAPSGKPYSTMWIARVLQDCPQVKSSKMIISKKSKDGLAYETKVTAYSI